MPRIYDMGLTALLPLRRKACWGFFRPKNPTASAGFEPADLGTKGQHATPRPPKPFPPFCTSSNIPSHSVSALNYAGACLLFAFQRVLSFLFVYYGSLTFFAAFGWHVSHEETILCPQIACSAWQCWWSILVSSIESPFFWKQQWILLKRHSCPSLRSSQ